MGIAIVSYSTLIVPRMNVSKVSFYSTIYYEFSRKITNYYYLYIKTYY